MNIIKNDCCELENASKEAFINNLKIRFIKDRIYTYVAKILIALNPYKPLEGMYSKEKGQMYRQKGIGELSSHIYAIASSSEKNLMLSGTSQTIIVCGDSGSGKTETTKHLAEFLCSNNQIFKQFSGVGPLIEAFGNATTQNNLNSSRFVKLFQIHYDDNKKICGGKIEYHSLEISRVSNERYGEHNFHVFYYLFKGAPAAIKKLLHLQNVSFKYLLDSSNELDYAIEFNNLDNGLSEIGLLDDRKMHLYKVLALILHLGNIEFESERESEGCSIATHSLSSLTAASEIMNIDIMDMKRFLLKRSFVVNTVNTKSSTEIPLTVSAASKARNTISKELYSTLFRFVMSKTNDTIPSEISRNNINVLDIPGFECFDNNYFEQLTINYTNEKLQQFWSARLIEDEVQVYQDECLDIGSVPFFDNKAVLDLLEMRSRGLFSLLDDESRSPRPSHNNFILKIENNWAKHEALQLCTEGFIIRHFAGNVHYNTTNFIEKNSEKRSDSVVAIVERVIKPLFSNVSLELKSKSTLAKLKQDVTSLIEQLRGNDLSFIRCIKPNTEKKSGIFDESYVLSQLDAAGVFAFYHLMRKGYPTRLDIDEYFKKYSPYLSAYKLNIEANIFCDLLLRSVGFKRTDFKIGTTKILLRPGNYDMIDRLKMFEAKIMEQNTLAIKKKLIARLKWKTISAAIYFYINCCRRLKMHGQETFSMDVSSFRKTEKDGGPIEVKRVTDGSHTVALAEQSSQINQDVLENNLARDTKTKRALKRKAEEEPTEGNSKVKAKEERPLSETRFDKYDHFAYHDDSASASRCKNENCKQKTHVLCRKCNLHLCFTKGRNCFYKFHH